jgi:hypothetical protein
MCFVPNAIGHSKNGPEYRYIATREVMQEQLHLPGMADEKEYACPTMAMDRKKCNESYFEWFVALRARISALGFVSSG